MVLLLQGRQDSKCLLVGLGAFQRGRRCTALIERYASSSMLTIVFTLRDQKKMPLHCINFGVMSELKRRGFARTFGGVMSRERGGTTASASFDDQNDGRPSRPSQGPRLLAGHWTQPLAISSNLRVEIGVYATHVSGMSARSHEAARPCCHYTKRNASTHCVGSLQIEPSADSCPFCASL